VHVTRVRRGDRRNDSEWAPVADLRSEETCNTNRNLNWGCGISAKHHRRAEFPGPSLNFCFCYTFLLELQGHAPGVWLRFGVGIREVRRENTRAQACDRKHRS